MGSGTNYHCLHTWALPLDNDEKADARAEVLKGAECFCQERLFVPADDAAALLERVAQPFSDLMQQHRMMGICHLLLLNLV